nr:hypothetical protein [Victivallales bacterium]
MSANKIKNLNKKMRLALLLAAVCTFANFAIALETPDKYPDNESWKNARQGELQTALDSAVARGAPQSELSKIREGWVNENRAMERGTRSAANRELVKDVFGVSDDKDVQRVIDEHFEHSGTKPEEGQGRFGDVDLTPDKEAWKKIKEYQKKNPDKVKDWKVKAGTIGIPGQETIIHNPNKYYEYSVEKGPDGKVRIAEPGKGPVKRVDTVALRAGDKESYISYEFDSDGKIVMQDGASVGYDRNGNPVRKPGPKIVDPHLNNLDNMKKLEDHLSERGNFEYSKNQSTAKSVMRIIE